MYKNFSAVHKSKNMKSLSETYRFLKYFLNLTFKTVGARGERRFFCQFIVNPNQIFVWGKV